MFGVQPCTRFFFLLKGFVRVFQWFVWVQQLRDKGIAVVRVGAKEMEVFDECYRVAKEYFEGKSKEEKEVTKMGTESDW